MRFDPDFPLATQQAVPIDRAVTLLMPAGFYPDQLGSEPPAADSSSTALPSQQSDRAPGLREGLLGFLSRLV